MTKKHPLGVIHGRFQILHLDHLKYILSGKERCEHLVVGITNPDPSLTKKDAADEKRSDPANNPLTYFERYRLVRAALLEAGVGHEEFSVVPLPVNAPELYKYYVPMDAVFFLSIYDDWGRRKLALFQSLGLRTEILREVSPEEKGLSSTDARRAMAEGRPWEQYVSASVAGLLKAWDIPGRIRGMRREM